MENIITEKKTINKFYYILIFLFIYISDDTLLFGTNSNTTFITFKYAFIIVCALLLGIRILLENQSINRNLFFMISGLVFLIVISMVVNSDIRMGYFYKLCLLLYAFGITQLISFELFAEIFNKIIFIIAAISLIGFAVVIIAPSLLSVLPKIQNSVDAEFYNAYLFMSPMYFYSNFVRNQSIFREPGVYQMYLIMALLFQIYVTKSKSLIRYAVYIAAVITTMSTTGYIALAITLLALIFASQSLSNNKKIFVIFLLLFAFFMLFRFTSIFSIASEDQYNSVFGKLGSQGRSTTTARFASVTENLRMFIEKPLFGVGLTYLSDNFPLYAFNNYGFSTIHNTNTFLIQFASHGLLYGLMWIYAYWQFAKKLSQKYRLIVFLIIAVLYVGENLTYSGFSSLFLIYGIDKIGFDKSYEKGQVL